MWICAESHGISSPFIQIDSVCVMGIGFPLGADRCDRPGGGSAIGRLAENWRAGGGSDPSGDGVADLGGGAQEVELLGARLADPLGGIGLAEEVEHEGAGEDGGDGVGLLLA